jgi:carbon storage regulator CsrA
MLILSRKIGESVVIDGKVIVKIIRTDGDTVKVGIQAPSNIPVHRQEANREAATRAPLSQVPSLPNAKGKSPAAPNPFSPATNHNHSKTV